MEVVELVDSWSTSVYDPCSGPRPLVSDLVWAHGYTARCYDDLLGPWSSVHRPWDAMLLDCAETRRAGPQRRVIGS